MTEPYSALGGQPREPDPPQKRIGRRPFYETGCQHTTDPNGWLENPDGTLTGRKCPCWIEESDD